LGDLQLACRTRAPAMLEQAIADLDARLAGAGKSQTPNPKPNAKSQ
jgi:hypothetical protein